ncbi:hypothetical protein QJS10_CPB21g00358 [Acorus calamus]|uniref:Uncharacterized protein n=1 Tax=Acorus calamus TaxID=4465 RepID=A0AAV9C5W5_ACOCL|nr:hypothetical protein QJS10_CPB21g00358 [Acorus calamus]
MKLQALIILTFFITSTISARDPFKGGAINQKAKQQVNQEHVNLEPVKRTIVADHTMVADMVKVNSVGMDHEQARDSTNINWNGIKSDYHGMSTDSHHSIDPQTWDSQHPKPNN